MASCFLSSSVQLETCLATVSTLPEARGGDLLEEREDPGEAPDDLADVLEDLDEELVVCVLSLSLSSCSSFFFFCLLESGLRP